MTARTLLCPLLLSAVAGVIAFGAADAKSHKLQTVSLRKMADSLHAVMPQVEGGQAPARQPEPVDPFGFHEDPLGIGVPAVSLTGQRRVDADDRRSGREQTGSQPKLDRVLSAEFGQGGALRESKDRIPLR